MKKIILFLTTFLLLYTGKAQEVVPFKTRFHAFTQGDVMLFGNNILNRHSRNKSANSELDDIVSANNNDVLMEYIDIDEDKTTFSSSASDFISPTGRKLNVLFAGLYWSATYPYERGKAGLRTRIADDATRNPFDKVLLKTPGDRKYREIQGEIIFDGNEKLEYIKDAPYVAFADITNIFQEMTRPEGEYIVANVRGTRGYIPDGSSAGWVIVVVFEDPTLTTRKIDIKDGFFDARGYELPITFKDFKTLDKPSTPLLLGAALGSDVNVGENKIAIRVGESGGVFLESPTRKKTKFFNSSITEFEDYQLARRPASTNTLGFDIFNTEVPNTNNKIIPPKTQELGITVIAEKETFYTFLLGLSIESEEMPLAKLPTKPTNITSVIKEAEKKIEKVKKSKKELKKEAKEKEKQIKEEAKKVAEKPKVTPPEVKKPEVKPTTPTPPVRTPEVKTPTVPTPSVANPEVKKPEVKPTTPTPPVRTPEVKTPTVPTPSVVKAPEKKVAPAPQKIEPKTLVSPAPKKVLKAPEATNAPVVPPTKTEEKNGELRMLKSKDVASGYYTVLGVYEYKANAENFMIMLFDKGLECQGIFFYPEKSYYYVYYSKSSTYLEAMTRQKEILNIKRENNELRNMKNAWIFYVENIEDLPL